MSQVQMLGEAICQAFPHFPVSEPSLSFLSMIVDIDPWRTICRRAHKMDSVYFDRRDFDQYAAAVFFPTVQFFILMLKSWRMVWKHRNTKAANYS